MVGFGSSLRMARRAGWEKAYLDYETLKMLLSQIEAVYEEEGHRQTAEDDAFDLPRPRRKKRKRGRTNDYRDLIFLESDSDVAFASEAELLGDLSDYTSDEEMGQNGEGSAPPLQGNPFTMTWSQEETGSSGGEDSMDPNDSCGGGNLMGWRRESKTPVVEPSRKSRRRPGNKRRSNLSPGREQSDFFVGEDNTGRGQSSLLNTPLQQGYSTEATALLQQPTLDHEDGSFYSFGRNGLTPPTDFSGNAFQPNPITVGVSVTKSQTMIPPRQIPPAEAKQNKFDAERRRKRRQRRRRKEAKRRRELERRVPQHLRLAHAKARSITERFLGLLRAEVEKVTLFAQSRLGELADTAGSLRFPSCDDSEFGSFSSRPRGGGYEHPLSDGGMHPSASSSDDEYGTGIFPWSDSDDDDSDAGSRTGAMSPRFGRGGHETFSSTGNISSMTDQAANLTAKRAAMASESNRGEKMPSNKSKNSAFDAAQRQIAHFTAIRCERPTFQRNDHIVGEDLLLLSAVDEADGYTAVGVELMHVLRFICVNVIAVRKICRKHDRLLMNRMLGGYYHRKRKQMEGGGDVSKLRKQQKQSLTLGSIVSRSLGEDCEVDPASVSGLNQNKLVGVYDLKVQDLANSPTVQVVSSCLALALSEYEVSRSRADALSKLNSMTSRGEPPQRNAAAAFGTGLTPPSTAPFGLSPSRWLSKNQKQNELSPGYESLGVETPYDSDLDSDRESGGPPSTASSISLTRLRFTVVSIFALRESARFKLDFHNIFLCRSFLSFNGPNVVGEGLDGCSREVLDFLIAYNPDSALLLDSSTLYKGLLEGKWRTLPIGKVMLSSLSMAVTSPMTFANKSIDVRGAVSIDPNLTVDMPLLTNGSTARESKEIADECNGALLRLSRMSCLLYSVSSHCSCLIKRYTISDPTIVFFQMNDYIIHATANSFVRYTGAHPAYSANLIGATSFAALFATGFSCYQLSNESISKDWSAVTLRVVFVLAAVIAILGNIVYITGVSRESIAVAVVGRLLIGLASSDILHREIVTDCLLPIYVVPESARLVKWRVYGRIWGLLVGSFLGSFSLQVTQRLTIGAFQSASYLMTFLWIVQAFRLFFVMPESVESIGREQNIAYDGDACVPLDRTTSQSEEFSSDESESPGHSGAHGVWFFIRHSS